VLQCESLEKLKAIFVAFTNRTRRQNGKQRQISHPIIIFSSNFVFPGCLLIRDKSSNILLCLTSLFGFNAFYYYRKYIARNVMSFCPGHFSCVKKFQLDCKGCEHPSSSYFPTSAPSGHNPPLSQLLLPNFRTHPMIASDLLRRWPIVATATS
jgi:hypothetical protein